MIDVKQLLDQYLGGQNEAVAAGSSKAGNFGGPSGGALAGGLVGLLAGTKAGRKIGKNALIGAVKADGEIDAQEQRRIFGQVEALGLDAEMRTFVSEELARPLDLEEIIAPAACPEAAAGIYAASLLAADPSGPA